VVRSHARSYGAAALTSSGCGAYGVCVLPSCKENSLIALKRRGVLICRRRGGCLEGDTHAVCHHGCNTPVGGAWSSLYDGVQRTAIGAYYGYPSLQPPGLEVTPFVCTPCATRARKAINGEVLGRDEAGYAPDVMQAGYAH
jgi:hypothetical protein